MARDRLLSTPPGKTKLAPYIDRTNDLVMIIKRGASDSMRAEDIS